MMIESVYWLKNSCLKKQKNIVASFKFVIIKRTIYVKVNVADRMIRFLGLAWLGHISKYIHTIEILIKSLIEMITY